MSQVQYIKRGGSGISSFSVVTIIMMLLYVMPQTMVFVHNDMLAIIAALYYIVFVSKYVPSRAVISTLLFAVPYLLIYWINGFPGNIKLGFVLPLMTLWTLLMPCFAVVAIAKRNIYAEQKIILMITGITILYISISTFFALSVNPLIMRYEGADDALIHQARMMGVGGYGTAYFIGALFIALWALSKEVKYSFIKPFVYYAMIVICGLLVVRSQYATLLFITLFGIAMHYVFEANSISKKITVIVLSFIIVFLAQPLIQFGMSFFGDQMLGFKFQLVFDGLWGGSGVENISGERSNFQLNAFNLFLQSPLFGLPGAVNMEDYVFAHSEIISVMASTGLIGIISYIFCFYSSIKYVVGNCFTGREEKQKYYPVIIFYLAFALLNPISSVFECSWIIFCIIPLLIMAVRIRVKY